MTDYSRRGFITKASLGVAVAGVAAVTGLPALPAVLAATPTAAEPEPDLAAVGEDVVAHVTNASTGELTVMIGTREIVHRDRQLVGRLLGAARRAGQEG